MHDAARGMHDGKGVLRGRPGVPEVHRPQARGDRVHEAQGAVRAQSYEAVGRSSGVRDAMAATDARIDAESAAAADLADMRREVEGGRELCRGIRAAHGTTRWADALELHYIEDMPWTQTASVLGVSERQAQLDVSCALDWVDSVGIAAARSGMGQAALF